MNRVVKENSNLLLPGYPIIHNKEIWAKHYLYYSDKKIRSKYDVSPIIRKLFGSYQVQTMSVFDEYLNVGCSYGWMRVYKVDTLQWVGSYQAFNESEIPEEFKLWEFTDYRYTSTANTVNRIEQKWADSRFEGIEIRHQFMWNYSIRWNECNDR